MIGRLRGTLVRRSPDRVLLDVGGVGYLLQIPLSTFYSLATGGGETVALHVHTHVREDALQLFGFATEQERAAFEKLIAISGVGPRLALSILSGIGVDELRAALVRRDRERLERIPGVGKRTAERVLLELRDKFGVADVETDAGPAGAGAGAPGLRADAVSALVNLGYSRSVAERAVGQTLDTETPDAGIETILKAALAGLAR